MVTCVLQGQHSVYLFVSGCNTEGLLLLISARSQAAKSASEEKTLFDRFHGWN